MRKFLPRYAHEGLRPEADPGIVSAFMNSVFRTSIFLAICSISTAAAAPTADQLEFFEKRIRPVLAQECYECHNSVDKRKGGLVLDHRAGLLAGGESGKAIVPGNADGSLLIQSIRHQHAELKMPKNGAKFEPNVVQDFVDWINQGAADPRDTAPTAKELAAETSWEATRERRKLWWSFQPISNPPVPAGDAPNPVDRFLNQQLSAAKLTPSPKADEATLQRRLSYVLTGLPKVNDATTVDALLASPRFGERWARHWMDWVRYAESSGSEGDPAIPNAYRYRNYLIRALNEDVPFDQLVREHLAGDLLEKPRTNSALQINESAIGPAHLRMCFHGFAPTDALEELVRFTDDQIDTVTKAFLGLTVSCARCHNHKFDAISQADYYALYGVFATTRPAQITIDTKDKQQAHQAALASLKTELRGKLVDLWKSKRNIPKIDSVAWDKMQREFTDKQRGSVSGQPVSGWFAHGNGISATPSKAGEFRIASEGDKILAGIFPAGYFSNLLSTKHSATLQSPRQAMGADQAVYVRVAGEDAMARYVVQNYPREGTVFPVNRLSSPEFKWIKWDLSYWKGDSIHVELTTANESPVMAKGVPARSWFGITDWKVQDKALPPPTEPGLVLLFRKASPNAEQAYNSALETALTAWKNGTMSNDDAEFLRHCLEKNILPNGLQELPEVAELVKRYRSLEAELPFPTRAPGVLEGDLLHQPLMVRGDHKQLAEVVPQRFLEAIDPRPFQGKQSSRPELAEAFLAENNPLLARVIVNRLWHHVFGRGLVATPDNFGRLGSAPTHPELLDFLATKFRADGWSIKKTLKLLVTSEAFQRSAAPPEGVAVVDPDNKLLSHFSVRRLDAEAIRDTLLQVSGKLDFAMETPAVDGGAPRRSVFVNVIRTNLDPFLNTFDAPPPNSPKGNRDITNVPAQSLTMMNAPFIVDTAKSLVSGVKSLPEEEARIQQLYAKALGRPAAKTEVEQCLKFIRDANQAREGDVVARRELEAKLTISRDVLAKQLDPVRSIPVVPIALPVPLIGWDFSKPVKGLTLQHGAKIEGGALVLNGGKAHASTEPIAYDLTEKTLTAWVQLNNLEQGGGGVITLQTVNGETFDGIIFAEKSPRQWVAGSNFWKRTESFQGPEEAMAKDSAVHVAIVYAADGTISCYRNGELYGKPYRSEKPIHFRKGESQILLGCRHGSPEGNRVLSGRIFSAQVFNHALSQDDVRVLAKVRATLTTEELIAKLPAADQAKAREHLQSIKSMEESLASVPPDSDPWLEVAHALLNTKELIYLR